jgi:hypothetical protein
LRGIVPAREERQLRHDHWADAEIARITRQILRRTAVSGDGAICRVKVLRHSTHLEDALLQSIGGNNPLERRAVVKAASLVEGVVEKSVLNDGAADRNSEPVIYAGRLGDVQKVVAPAIGIQTIIIMIFIKCAMDAIGAGFGDERDLPTSGTSKGGIRVVGNDAKRFD